MSILPDLERELEAAARRTSRQSAHRGRRTRTWPVLAAVMTLAVAGGAWAAGTMLRGDPVEPLFVVQATKGYGAPIASSVKLLDVRTPDPAGGPAWGLRVLRTTRGLGCLQFGRVVDGRLGVLGRDGVAGDDGKFHELPAEAFEHLHCRPHDARDQTFIAFTLRFQPASAAIGIGPGCAHEVQQRGIPASVPRLPVCDPASLRRIAAGLVGPLAESVTYRAGDGRSVTQRVSGPEGAYLIVDTPRPGARANGAITGAMTGPGSVVTRVNYKDGSVCRVPPSTGIGGARPCPPRGYVRPDRRKVTSRDVATKVTAKVGRHRFPAPVGSITARAVEVRFRARRPVTDALATYTAFVEVPRRTCGYGGSTGGGVTEDTRAGEVATIVLTIPDDCRGRLRGEVRYVVHDGVGSQPLMTPLGDGVLVGRFSVAAR